MHWFNDRAGFNVLYISLGLVLVSQVACDSSIGESKTPDVLLQSADVKAFVAKIRNDLVFVEGGEFMMGDFGVAYGDGVPYDMEKDSRPLHLVQLSAYSMSKFKISNHEYQFYLAANGLTLRQFRGDRKFKRLSQHPRLPAHIDWFEAQQYCSWLSQISGLPFALPTEAQWEYAARSRGGFHVVSTDNGAYKIQDVPYGEDGSGGPRGINISTNADRVAFAQSMGWPADILTSLPVDYFPPNSIGMYSMTDNGFEWVGDWYDANYYSRSPLLNPPGPDNPVMKSADSTLHLKVLRGVAYAESVGARPVTMDRSFKSPDAVFNDRLTGQSILILTDKTARCAVNSSSPID